MKNPWKVSVQSLKQNWRFDLAAGLSSAMVSLPLSLGIATAAEIPPISGVIAAIVGGIVGGLFNGTYVGIKGPSPAIIVVVLAAKESLGAESGLTYEYILAAFLVSGCIQIVLGVFRTGVIADFLPGAVIKGILAAVGLIIIAKQIGPGLGVKVDEMSPLMALKQIPQYIMKLNPFIAIITLNGLVVLIILPRFRTRLIGYIPPAMWVLLLSIPFAFLFDLSSPNSVVFNASSFTLNPEEVMVHLPDDFLQHLQHPDFGMWQNVAFWQVVMAVTLVSTVENLASSKAIEKLDPLGRKTRVNRDLMSSGLCTVGSALIGGMPVITVIARTSININHGAKSTVSNFIHGLLCLLFVAYLSDWLEVVPMAALSAILIFTGYRLASPKTFIDAQLVGTEQLVVLVITILSTLRGGIAAGIATGILSTLVIHALQSGMSIKLFLHYLFRPKIMLVREAKGRYLVRIKGVVNFFNILRFKKILNRVPAGKQVEIDVSNTRLIDYNILEYLNDLSEEYNLQKNGEMEIVGLDVHHSSTSHPYSLHVHHPTRIRRLTKRQAQLEAFAHKNGWSFHSERDWNAKACKAFRFFASRPVEHRKNILHGSFDKLNCEWEVSDVTFDEGALVVKDVYRSTMQIVYLPVEIPVFTLEKEQFMDRVLELAGMGDVDFSDHRQFSKQFQLKGDDEEAIQQFFSKELMDFFVNHSVYKIESNGKALLLFKYFRMVSKDGVVRMIKYSESLCTLLLARAKKLDSILDKPF